MEEGYSYTLRVGGWVYPTAGLDDVERKTILPYPSIISSWLLLREAINVYRVFKIPVEVNTV